jgi:hypothetical protein
MIEDLEAFRKNQAEAKAKVQSILDNFKEFDANVTKLLTLCVKHLKYKSPFQYKNRDLYLQARDEQTQLLIALEDLLAKKGNNDAQP